MSHPSRSDANPRNHLNTIWNASEVNQAYGDTKIYPVVQLATKACLSLCCWGTPPRLRDLQPYLVLKSREWTLELRGDFTSYLGWLQTSQGCHISWQAPRAMLYSARSQAPRVTNKTASQSVNQLLFRVGESMELLSNQVLDPYPSRIDEEINGFA